MYSESQDQPIWVTQLSEEEAADVLATGARCFDADLVKRAACVAVGDASMSHVRVM